MRNGLPCLKNRPGASMVLVAVGLMLFVGMAAMAVDVGMIGTGKAQARRAAEAGALAGAIEYMNGALNMVQPPADTVNALQSASHYAQQNSMLANAISSSEVTSTFIRDQYRFRVTVDRSNVNTFFGRLLGVTTKDIRATAAAAIMSSPNTGCLKPFGLPNQAPFNNPDGSLILIWNQQNDILHLIGFDNFPPGTGNLEPYVASTCASATQTLSIGSTPPVAPDNNRIGQIRAGMYDMICSDPNLHWYGGSIGLSRDGGQTSATDWRNSPRVGTVGLYAPGPIANGATTFLITGFVAIYFERMDLYNGQNAPPDPPNKTISGPGDCNGNAPGGGSAYVYGRLWFARGTSSGGTGSTICVPSSTTPCVVRLVE